MSTEQEVQTVQEHETGWQRPLLSHAHTILAPFSTECSLQKLFHHIETSAPATAVHLILLQIYPVDSPQTPDTATLYSELKAVHGQMQHLPVSFEIRALPGTLPTAITTFAQRHEVGQIVLCGETAVFAEELQTQLGDQVIVM